MNAQTTHVEDKPSLEIERILTESLYREEDQQGNLGTHRTILDLIRLGIERDKKRTVKYAALQ